MHAQGASYSRESLYDDGDEGSYDMEREVWRLEGDRAAGEDEEEDEAEEGSAKTGKEKVRGGFLCQNCSSTSRFEQCWDE